MVQGFKFGDWVVTIGGLKGVYFRPTHKKAATGCHMILIENHGVLTYGAASFRLMSDLERIEEAMEEDR